MWVRDKNSVFFSYPLQRLVLRIAPVRTSVMALCGEHCVTGQSFMGVLVYSGCCELISGQQPPRSLMVSAVTKNNKQVCLPQAAVLLMTKRECALDGQRRDTFSPESVGSGGLFVTNLQNSASPQLTTEV